MFRDFTNWFCLVIGVLSLSQLLVLRVLRRWFHSERLRLRRNSWQASACLGMMLTVGAVSRMLDWSGTGLLIAFVVGAICAIGAIVFSIRNLIVHAAESG